MLSNRQKRRLNTRFVVQHDLPYDWIIGLHRELEAETESQYIKLLRKRLLS